MKPTRRSQPYRQGGQAPGQALSAMLAGKPAFLPNPSHQPQSGGHTGGLSQQMGQPPIPRRRKRGKVRRPIGQPMQGMP